MNEFIFFWLVVFAIIGILCVLFAGAGLFALFYAWFKQEQKTRLKAQEYEGMKRSLLDTFR